MLQLKQRMYQLGLNQNILFKFHNQKYEILCSNCGRWERIV
jgi:hypothetical protein